MMELSHSTSYAVYALSCLESVDSHPQLIRAVAERVGVPKPYLAKIVNQLSHKGIVVAKRGYHGGITLSRPAKEISLLEIVLAVEGPKWIGDCLLSLGNQSVLEVCPTRLAWRHIRAQIEELLRRTTLADVLKCIKKSERAYAGKGKDVRAEQVVPLKRHGVQPSLPSLS